jgi:muramoyltetrapeptide carboxypeptidase
MIRTPPYLKKGDTIAITCPAGYMEADKVQTCIDSLKQWGYKVMLGKTIGSKSKTYFSGTDEERCSELQAMLDDKNINAILCGRGGYGVSRIIDRLDFTLFKKHPKWIIGFSDITVLLAHLNQQLKTASLHAPMANAFNDGGAKKSYVQSLQKALKGVKSNYSCQTHAFNRAGDCSGELVGGNLALIAHLAGTKSAYKTTGKILFIEDIGEYIYNIDRMIIQLKRAGMLSGLSGLVVGKFTDVHKTVRPFGQTVQQIIQSHIAEYDYPVCYDFPVSHEEENVALKVGVPHSLKITKNKATLKEV